MQSFIAGVIAAVVLAAIAPVGDARTPPHHAAPHAARSQAPSART